MIMPGLILAGLLRSCTSNSSEVQRECSQPISIDKTSSVELSEAINSMYAYYENSGICYTYLVDFLDVDDDDEVEVDTLAGCKWFTRGWTFQELVAPSFLELYSSGWKEIGTKISLSRQIARITGIDEKVLTGAASPSSHLVATRLSWAAKRQTTKAEDGAYCLMCLFKINMPLIYGEGEGAFRRLQDEILKSTEDYSILAWGLFPNNPVSALIIDRRWIAANLNSFSLSQSYHPALAIGVTNFACQYMYASLSPGPSPNRLGDNEVDGSPPILTSRGLKICLDLLQVYDHTYYLAYLNILLDGAALCIFLRKSGPMNKFCRASWMGPMSPQLGEPIQAGFVLMNPGHLHLFRTSSIYIAHDRKDNYLRFQPSLLQSRHEIPIDASAVRGGCEVVGGPVFDTYQESSLRRLIWFRFGAQPPCIIVVGHCFCLILDENVQDEALRAVVGNLYSEEFNCWNDAAVAITVDRVRAFDCENTDRAVKRYGSELKLTVSMKRRPKDNRTGLVAVFMTDHE